MMFFFVNVVVVLCWVGVLMLLFLPVQLSLSLTRFVLYHFLLSKQFFFFFIFTIFIGLINNNFFLRS